MLAPSSGSAYFLGLESRYFARPAKSHILRSSIMGGGMCSSTVNGIRYRALSSLGSTPKNLT